MTDDIQSQLENYLEQQDAPSPDEADQHSEEVTPDAEETVADEETEETTDEADDAPEKPEDDEAEGDEDEQDETDYLTIKHNGEEKKVSKKEAIELTQKGYDYDVKTARLAEERRTVEAEAQRTREVFQEAETKRTKLLEELQVVEAFNSFPLYSDEQLQQILAKDGAEAYLKAKDQEDKRLKVVEVVRTKLSQHQEELNQAHQKRMEEVEAQEREQLKIVMPELLTEEGTGKLVGYLKNSYGFTAEQISSTTNHKLFVLAEKARKYDELQAKGAERKPVTPLPKVIKASKGRQDVSQVNAQKSREYLDRAKKTGKTEDAASAILRLLN